MGENQKSLEEVFQSVETNQKTGWKKILSFVGPAYLVSIGYMDPGNWATDLAGGSKYGYTLIWVLLMSNIMAIFLQTLAARLGIVYGRDLAQASRETFPRYVNYALYAFAEIAIIATDLAEVLGMAIGIQLLFGLPIVWGVSISILDTFLLLYLQQFGIKKLELFIISLIAIIATSFIIQLSIAQPQMSQIVKGFVPSLPNSEALYIAIGIIGATIMPHNLYLHSALVQTRKISRNFIDIKKALRINFFDSAIALNIAFFINASILILAASVFHFAGRTDVVEIGQAYHLLSPMLGNQLAPILFAIALIAAGQSSTITGTLAGQIVMEGYLQFRINPWIRRLITRLLATIPVYLIVAFHEESRMTEMLILSQVVLSCQLGFAIIPLVHFVSDKQKMKEFVISKKAQIVAWVIVATLVGLNAKMIFNEFALFYTTSSSLGLKLLFVFILLILVGLLLYVLFYPYNKSIHAIKQKIASPITPLSKIDLSLTIQKSYHTIAIPLDFSNDDNKLLQYAITQKNVHTKFILIHIIETASAKFLGSDADDFETRKNEAQLNQYKQILENMGIATTCILGYKNRNKEIIAIVKKQRADLLVIGSHGHTGVKDILFGETINQVRHALKIPIFIINLDDAE